MADGFYGVLELTGVYLSAPTGGFVYKPHELSGGTHVLDGGTV